MSVVSSLVLFISLYFSVINLWHRSRTWGGRKKECVVALVGFFVPQLNADFIHVAHAVFSFSPSHCLGLFFYSIK